MYNSPLYIQCMTVHHLDKTTTLWEMEKDAIKKQGPLPPHAHLSNIAYLWRSKPAPIGKGVGGALRCCCWFARWDHEPRRVIRCRSLACASYQRLIFFPFSFSLTRLLPRISVPFHTSRVFFCSTLHSPLLEENGLILQPRQETINLHSGLTGTLAAATINIYRLSVTHHRCKLPPRALLLGTSGAIRPTSDHHAAPIHQLRQLGHLVYIFGVNDCVLLQGAAFG